MQKNVFVQFTCSMSKKRLQSISFFSLIFFFLFHTVQLQAQRMKTLLADGDKAFADNDFFGASIYYNRALLQDSSDITIQYKYADASRLNFDYDIADHWYSKVYKADPQGKLYPECVFWIATLKKNKGKYKDAKKII